MDLIAITRGDQAALKCFRRLTHLNPLSRSAKRRFTRFHVCVRAFFSADLMRGAARRLAEQTAPLMAAGKARGGFEATCRGALLAPSLSLSLPPRHL